VGKDKGITSCRCGDSASSTKRGGKGSLSILRVLGERRFLLKKGAGSLNAALIVDGGNEGQGHFKKEDSFKKRLKGEMLGVIKREQIGARAHKDGCMKGVKRLIKHATKGNLHKKKCRGFRKPETKEREERVNRQP